jgi:hypothetical protein
MKPIRDLRAYGDALTRAASTTEGGRIAARALDVPVRAPWVRRAVVVLTTLVAFGGANVGLAFAANPSVPGDPLYGIDRAYERIASALGIHLNVAAERFQEAAVLTDRGELSAAFQVASEAMESLGSASSPATEALDQAAKDAESIESGGVPADVQERLNRQAKELFGIGEEVSVAATGSLQSLDLQFVSRSQQVLDAVRSAQAEMREAKGQTTPPGLDTTTTTEPTTTTAPGKSGEPHGKSGDTSGRGDHSSGNQSP